MSSPQPRKPKFGKSKAADPEDSRRRREDFTVQIRKQKQQEQLMKHRKGAAAFEGEGEASPLPGSDNIPLLASVLHNPHSDLASKLEATMRFRKILSIEKSPPIDNVIAANVVPTFVQLLQLDHSPKLQFEACWALTNIASGTTENTRAVIEAGAVPQFVRLLDSPDAEVREQAVWALGNIAGDSVPTRMAVLNAGVVPPLLRALTPQAKLTFVRNATWTISNLVRSKVVGGVAQPAMGAVRALLPRLAALVTTDDKDVLVDALWALSYMSDGEEDRVLPFLEAGCLPRVVALLSHPNKEVVVPALRTIGNIVTGDDMMTQAVLNEGALPHIATLLQPGNPKNICKEACWLVSNVCAGTQSQIAAVLAANCVPALIHHMTKSSPEIAREACWALSNATTGGSAQQIYLMVTQGIIAPFHGMLLRAQDPRVQMVAIEGLENILMKPPPPEYGQAPDLYRQHMERAEVPEAMMHILDHNRRDSPLYMKAEAFLGVHFPNWGSSDDYDDDYGVDGGEEEEEGEEGGVEEGEGLDAQDGEGDFAQQQAGMVMAGMGGAPLVLPQAGAAAAAAGLGVGGFGPPGGFFAPPQQQQQQQQQFAWPPQQPQPQAFNPANFAGWNANNG